MQGEITLKAIKNNIEKQPLTLHVCNKERWRRITLSNEKKKKLKKSKAWALLMRFYVPHSHQLWIQMKWKCTVTTLFCHWETSQFWKKSFLREKKSPFFDHNNQRKSKKEHQLSRFYCLSVCSSSRSSEKHYFFDSEPGIRLFVSSNLFIWNF